MSGLFLLRPMTGMERYALEVLYRLDALIDPRTESLTIVVPKGHAAKVPSDLKNTRVEERGRWRGGNLAGYLWEQVHFAAFLRREGVQGYLPLNFVPALQPDVVVTIHDGNPLTHPEFYPTLSKKLYRVFAATLLRRARANTTRIITVSEASKAELVGECQFVAHHISIASPGLEHVPRNPQLKSVSGLNADFYFALSSATYNKNFEWVLNQAALQPDRQFVIAGAGDFRSLLSRHGYSDLPNVRHLGYVSDAERNYLYKNCRAFLFPSRYEGFGMPPIEAACLGAALVVSDIPPLREIFGEDFVYVNPATQVGDIDDYTNVVDPEALRERFAWNLAATRVYELLRQPCVLNNREPDPSRLAP